jgi:hypothetical protein
VCSSDLIHRDVTGFLDLRWRHFVKVHKFSDLGSNGWMNVFAEKFEEFILWVADVVERETNTGGTTVEKAVRAIQNNTIELDAMTGGIKLKIQWSKLQAAYSLVDIKNISRREFEELKAQVLQSMLPKGGRVEANNFIQNLYGMGPGKYRFINDLPYNFKWIDWYEPMIAEANRIQILGQEVRRAEGSVLEFMGYSRISSNSRGRSDLNRTIQSQHSDEFTYHNEEQDYPRQDQVNRRHDDNLRGGQGVAFDSPSPKNNYGSYGYSQEGQGTKPFSRQATPQKNQGYNPGTPNNAMSKYIPFSTGSRHIPREGYTQWVKPAGVYEDGKEYYLCQACGIVKSFHRPEYCPALKTNSRYANGSWRDISWDASPGADL